MPKNSPEQEADRILEIWKEAAQKGLGRKKFAKGVISRYEPRLRKKILAKLKTDAFDKKAETATRRVATDLGTVCAILTPPGKTEVTKDVFQRVFLLMKSHPVCPQQPAGGGGWCDVPL